MSDTHGRIKNFEKIRLKQPGAELFIHLGDGLAEVDTMRANHPGSAFTAVRGNCDFSSSEPYEKLLVLEDKRIFLTHGHRYSVKSGLDRLMEAALLNRADVVLFGHTHQPYIKYQSGMHILNPGSAERPADAKPKFGIIDIINGCVSAHLSDIQAAAVQLY